VLNRIKTAAHRKEYLQIILKETESLKRMINNILDFSRKEKGKQRYNFEEVNVTLLVNEAIHDLEYWLVEKKFILVKEIEEHVTAMADRAASESVGSSPNHHNTTWVSRRRFTAHSSRKRSGDPREVDQNHQRFE